MGILQTLLKCQIESPLQKGVNTLLIFVHQIKSVAWIASQVGETVYCTESDQLRFHANNTKLATLASKDFLWWQKIPAEKNVTLSVVQFSSVCFVSPVTYHSTI